MRNSFFLIQLLSLVFPLFALQSLEGPVLEEGDKYGISLEFSSGYLNGRAREIVYDTGDESTEGMSSSNGYYLSELIWELNDIYYIGASSSFNFLNRAYINAGVKTAVSKGVGFMNDYDWIAGYDLHDRDGKTDLSHWSLSSVEVLDSLIFDVNSSFDFLNDRLWSFLFVIGYRYLYWDWTDSVLDSMYDGIDDVIPVGTNAIDYNLAFHLPYFGIRGGYVSASGLSIKGNLHYSPFAFGLDHDHHILRDIHFYDIIKWGHYVFGSLETGYHFNSFFGIKFVISGDYLFERMGNTYAYNGYGTPIGSWPDGAGMQYQSLSITLCSVFSF
ncbi:MAG: omptin family outer membrane protease [Spirochaetales bacterium]|nr:omptin family outer membrane protease [Spirochaetales bacterium]